MNLSQFALKYKPIVLALIVLLFAWGVNTFFTAPRSEDPQYIIRDAIVTAAWPGATAEQVEKLVTDKIETTCSNIKQIRKTESTSYPGIAVVQITAADSVKDVAEAWTKVRAELRLLEPQLPTGCLPPDVDDNFGDTSVLGLALYQDQTSAKEARYTPRQLEIFAKRLRDELIDLRPDERDTDGDWVPITTEPAYVMKLDLYGVQKEVIYLETKLGRWSELAVTSDQLASAIAQRNVVSPAGVINTRDSRVIPHLTGDIDAVREVSRVNVARSAGGNNSAGRATDLDAIKQVSIASHRATNFDVPVALKDLGIRVRRDYEDPPSTLTRISDGETSADCVVLSFTMKPGVNIARMSESVDRLLATANESLLPPDIRVTKISDPPLAVKNKIGEVSGNLVQSVEIVLVVLVFLAGFRVAFVTAASIPLVMFATIALMTLFGVHIEQISLAALIVALGLLVDSATVVCDNTNRYLAQGMSRSEAAVKGPTEVASSLLMSTLTSVAVFVPMLFCLKGSNQEYVYSLPIVVSLALLISWVFALTSTPIMTRYLLAPMNGVPIVNWFLWLRNKVFGKNAQNSQGAASRAGKPSLYVRVCMLAIRFRWATTAVFFGMLCASMMLPIKSSFFPNSDRAQFVVDIALPASSTIQQTDEVASRVEALIGRLAATTWVDGEWVTLTDHRGEAVDRLQNMSIFVGNGGPRFYMGLNPKASSPSYAVIWVNAESGQHVQRYIDDVRRAAEIGLGSPGDDDYLPPIAGARVVPHPLVMGTPVSSPIEYRLMGPRLANEKVLRHHGDRIEQALRNSGLVWDVHNSWGELGEQLDVQMHTDRANLAGVTRADVADTLNTYYSGLQLTDFRDGDRLLPVKLRLAGEQRQSLRSLRAAYVEGDFGKVPLDAVADLEMKQKPVKISRFQRNRLMAVRARPESGLLADEVLQALEPRIQAIEAELPAGYRIQNGGIQESADQGARQNATSLGVGGALIVLCLIIQYNSWIKPMIILLTVPLSIIGGLVGLYLMGIPLGFMETLGFLALFGTVMNAAILMIDFTESSIQAKLASGDGVARENERSCSGLSVAAFQRCVAEAAQSRLMPIFMTTTTTIGGLLSLMFGGGPLFKGLATVFAVGLAVGTTITLLALPAIFAIFVQDFGLNVAGKRTESQATTG